MCPFTVPGKKSIVALIEPISFVCDHSFPFADKGLQRLETVACSLFSVGRGVMGHEERPNQPRLGFIPEQPGKIMK
jgi:hypothetical protein